MKDQQRAWMKGLFEAAPVFVFMGLWHSGHGIGDAAMAAAGAAAVVLIALGVRKIAYAPLLLGTNVHFLLAAPLIRGAFALGYPEVGEAMISWAQGGVVATIAVVGLAYHLISPRGFVGSDDLPEESRRRYSWALLGLAFVLAPLGLFGVGGFYITIVLPILALSGIRSFLMARAADHNGGGDKTTPFAVAGMPQDV